jgi:hypothetical protein
VCHVLLGLLPTLTPPSAIALAMGMRPVVWTSSNVGVPAGGFIQWESQGELRSTFHPVHLTHTSVDWRMHSGGVQSVPDQASFQATLDSSPQFSNSSSPPYSTTHQGVVVLQHDIYVESVNLVIGYTVP